MPIAHRPGVTRAGVALAGLAMTAGLTACGSGADEASDGQTRLTPTATSTPGATATPTSSREISPVEVASLLDRALSEATLATVTIQSGSYNLDGVADYTGPPADPGSLMGDLDLRQSDQDTTYVARDGQVRATIPAGVEFPESRDASAINPWGFAMAKVDPVVVSFLVRTLGVSAFESDRSDGRLFRVAMPGEETLVAFGYEANAAMPDELDYDLGFDDDGRLVRISARFERFGAMSVTFADWRAAGSTA